LRRQSIHDKGALGLTTSDNGIITLTIYNLAYHGSTYRNYEKTRTPEIFGNVIQHELAHVLHSSSSAEWIMDWISNVDPNTHPDPGNYPESRFTKPEDFAVSIEAYHQNARKLWKGFWVFAEPDWRFSTLYQHADSIIRPATFMEKVIFSLRGKFSP